MCWVFKECFHLKHRLTYVREERASLLASAQWAHLCFSVSARSWLGMDVRKGWVSSAEPGASSAWTYLLFFSPGICKRTLQANSLNYTFKGFLSIVMCSSITLRFMNHEPDIIVIHISQVNSYSETPLPNMHDHPVIVDIGSFFFFFNNFMHWAEVFCYMMETHFSMP